MYKVLYRKWRPKTFDEVIGQEHVTEILKNQISSGRIPHALMFCGIRGTGKTSCAKIFAKAVNCPNSVDGNPCLVCDICKKIESSSVLDVSEIDAASNNGVDNIRAIIEETNLVSTASKYRVYIIDEFHMLSSGAFNAFLRTLEEPKKNVIFILATTEYHKIPKTIISRCQRFEFRMVNPSIIKSRLKFVSENENLKISDDALNLIAKNSEGSVRDALSILDQCSNFGIEINEDTVMNALGLSDSSCISEIVHNLFNCKLKDALELVSELYKKGKNMVYICEMMMSFFHDVFCYKSSEFIFDSSNFKKEDIIKISSMSSVKVFLNCFDLLKDCYVQMQKNSNKKYELEEAIIKISYVINSDEISTEKETKIVSVDKKTDEKPVDETANNESTGNLKKVENWDGIVEKISSVSNSLSLMLRGTTAYLVDNAIMIDANSLVFDMINKSSGAISEIISEEMGKNYRICKLNKAACEIDSRETEKAEPKKSNIDSLINKASLSGIQMKFS